MTFVYVLTNEAMPGLIKVGQTSADVSDRMVGLDSTGVPLPFECYYAVRVRDANAVEKALHVALGDHRVRNSREFFRCDPIRAKAVLELVALEEVTPSELKTENPDDAAAIEETRKMRPTFRFSLADIPIGAKLTFARDSSIEARVVSDKEIEFEGETTSLSAAALIVIRRMGYKWGSVPGPQWWVYEGQTCSERRHEVERQS